MGPVVPIEGVVGTHTGCANAPTIDKTEREKRVNNLLTIMFIIHLIPKVVDVGMSG